MNKKSWLVAAGAAALGLALIALPSPTRPIQEPTPAPQVLLTPDDQDVDLGPNIVTAFSDEGGSWLGVETREVTADKMKELKLPAERGALIGKVLEDSPAAKSGLKDGDVVTEINGQRVEGAVQFRRMIREIPAGRGVQLTVWRDGRSQTITATLGTMQEHRRLLSRAAPQVFKFNHIPDMPEVGPVPGMPSLEWELHDLLPGKARLGIDAEDLNDQLASYFGAPDGEGILIRSVNPGSAAEKAGAKAGDVITSFNGERIHSVGELRSKLAAAGDAKTVKLGILRNKSTLTLDVEIPAAKNKTARKVEMRTKI